MTRRADKLRQEMAGGLGDSGGANVGPPARPPFFNCGTVIQSRSLLILQASHLLCGGPRRQHDRGSTAVLLDTTCSQGAHDVRLRNIRYNTDSTANTEQGSYGALSSSR
jgi:hypothetical protein